MVSELRTYGRLLATLGRFLRTPVTPEECRRTIARLLARREDAFVGILERGVFANTRSPYRALFAHAGIEFADAARLVRDDGIEAALSRFHDAGVHVTLEEFKCRRPIVRPGLELPVRVADFDNPLLNRHYEVRSGGSRSAGRRTHLDLDLIANDTIHHSLLQEAHGVGDRPWGCWQAVPPAGPGLKMCLFQAKLGRPMERWFTPTELSARPGTLRFFAFTHSTVAISRWAGARIPTPELTRAGEADRVAGWLAEKKAAGTPAALSTNVSLAVRVALAARAADLDIAGTFFRLHSEPFTPAKAAIIEASGSRAAMGYAMSELGPIGVPCTAPLALDDVHLTTDKVAIVQRERPLGPGGGTVDALLLTTVLPSAPKLMINADVGDYARVDQRDCGCPVGAVGYPIHLSHIRSYDKLTSEGNTFLGTDLIALLEETLPARFGGHAGDYQLAEEERDGLTRVNVVISPGVGAVEEEAVVRLVLDVLHANADTRLMAEVWRESGALRVLRREPYETPVSKMLPLHIPQRG